MGFEELVRERFREVENLAACGSRALDLPGQDGAVETSSHAVVLIQAKINSLTTLIEQWSEQ